MAVQKHTKMPKELELIRGTETLTMPNVHPELLSKMNDEYEHWWEYDSVRSVVVVMNLFGQACKALREYEEQISELQAEVQRLERLAQY